MTNMKLTFTLIALLFTTIGFSQNLTGIWRGHFVQNTFHLRSGQFVEDKYKYEVQINDLVNDAIEGVTYSYKSTLFYGKAAIQGIYTRKSKTLILKETKMLELKISDQSTACLMTCYLDYSKSAGTGKETLSGTYTSVNEINGTECGSGSVHLEKVKESDFEKEEFLLKKENTVAKHKNGLSLNKKPLPRKAAIKPGAEDFVISKEKDRPIYKLPDADTLVNKAPDTTAVAETPAPEKKDTAVLATIPDVLQKRENVLAQSFMVDSQDVKIEFYDNGQIDGDTISVYHNNIRIVNSQRLTYSPITMQIRIQKENPTYEFIVVAENLGSVPPNTALVIITSGSKHYEINIASDEQRNAKIMLNYQKAPSRN